MARSRLNRMFRMYLMFAVGFILASSIFIARDYYRTEFGIYKMEISDYYLAKDFKGVPLVFVTGDKENYSKTLTGYYDKETAAVYTSGTIVLFYDRLTFTGEDLYILFHEYGHHLWHTVMGPKEREKYAEIYRESEGFVTTYAIEGGVSEDFAETYMMFMVKPEYLPDAKKDFIYQMRKKYREFY